MNTEQRTELYINKTIERWEEGEKERASDRKRSPCAVSIGGSRLRILMIRRGVVWLRGQGTWGWDQTFIVDFERTVVDFSLLGQEERVEKSKAGSGECWAGALAETLCLSTSSCLDYSLPRTGVSEYGIQKGMLGISTSQYDLRFCW